MQNAIAEPAKNIDSVLRSHERLIRHLATRFLATGAHLDDLLQEGRIALWQAATRWRPDGGGSVWTYARRFVLAAMMKCASSHIDEGSDMLPDETPSDVDLEIEMLIRECLAMLSSEEADIVKRWLAGETFHVIAAALQKSDWYVRDALKSAITTLRERAS